MLDKSYIYILTIVALLFLAFVVKHSGYIEKRRNTGFLLSIMADVLVLAGYVGREITETYPSHYLGAFSNELIYGFAALIPFFMLYPIAEKNKAFSRILAALEIAELIFVISSVHTGLLFSIDAFGRYTRGPLYEVSFIWGAILYFIWGFLTFREYRKVELSDKLRLAAVFVLELAGIVLQWLDGRYKLVYIGAAFVLFVYYAFIIETDGKYDRMTGCFSSVHYLNSSELLESNTDSSILVADINGLKYTNDTQGHGIGNVLICAVARGLEDAVGDCGKVYRVGGDEFVVVINSRDSLLVSDIEEIAEKSFRDSEKKEGIEISASFGVAIREDGESFSDALKRADEEMYKQKRNYYMCAGRDRRKN